MPKWLELRAALTMALPDIVQFSDLGDELFVCVHVHEATPEQISIVNELAAAYDVTASHSINFEERWQHRYTWFCDRSLFSDLGG